MDQTEEQKNISSARNLPSSQIIEHSTLFPEKLKDCNVEQLLSIIDSEISYEYKAKLKKIIQKNNIDGISFENMADAQIQKLMNIEHWYVSNVTKPIHDYFTKNILIPIDSNYNDKSRHILQINTHNNKINTFSINNYKSYNHGIPLILTPDNLIKFLSKCLNIPIQIIEIIASFCLLNESIIAVSFSLNLLSESKLKEIYKYLSKMNNESKDVRSLPASKTLRSRFSDPVDRNSKTIYGKVEDIIDPSLFVKCINNEYQWIPSTIRVIDDTLCKIKIISSINRFKNVEKHQKLFQIYEHIISLMLPHFEDITQQKLIENGNELQIICKAIEYNMAKGSCYGTKWHYEGIKDIEHICAVGILYTLNELNECGMLELSADVEEIGRPARWNYLCDEEDKKEIKKDGNGKHFGIETNCGRCVVWNNYQLQHRLGFIQNGDGNDKRRQAVICMLVDPKYKIHNDEENDFNIILDHAKERREKVKDLRKGDVSRRVPYCHDCGAYGHWHNRPGGFPSEPTPIKIINID